MYPKSDLEKHFQDTNHLRSWGMPASSYGHTEGYSESSKFWNITNLDLVFIVVVLKLNCTIFNHFRDHYHLVFYKAWGTEDPGLTHGNKRATDLTGFTKYPHLWQNLQRRDSLHTTSKGASALSSAFGWRWHWLSCLPLKSDIAVNGVCSFSNSWKFTGTMCSSGAQCLVCFE